jgi:hypothetical protein
VVKPLRMSLAGRGDRGMFAFRSALGESVIEAEIVADSFPA